MWINYRKKRVDRRQKYRWSRDLYGWTIRCEKHPTYEIGTTYKQGTKFSLLPRVSRPRNDCDLCWRLYYNWFATKHADELLGEVAECEDWRQRQYHYSPRRRAWAEASGVDGGERKLLESLGLSQQFIVDYSARNISETRSFDDWVERALR
jgi:hypothetical protein